MEGGIGCNLNIIRSFSRPMSLMLLSREIDTCGNVIPELVYMRCGIIGIQVLNRSNSADTQQISKLK